MKELLEEIYKRSFPVGYIVTGVLAFLMLMVFLTEDVRTHEIKRRAEIVYIPVVTTNYIAIPKK